MRKIIFVVLIFVAVAAGQQNGFENFLQQAMQNYTSWMIASGLDPSPQIPFSVNLTQESPLLKVKGEIRDQRVTGHSNVAAYVLLAGLDARAFQIGLAYRHLNITGDYELEGSRYPNITVTGDGKFNVVTNGSKANMFFSKFLINPDGYIDLSPVTCTPIMYLPGPPETPYHFENLSAGGREDSVILLLYNSYDEQKLLWFPACELIKQYLGEVFEKTPVSEILSGHPNKKSSS